MLMSDGVAEHLSNEIA